MNWWISYQTRHDGSILQSDVVNDCAPDMVCQCIGPNCETLARSVFDGLSVLDALQAIQAKRTPEYYCGHDPRDDAVFDAGYAAGWNDAVEDLRKHLTPNGSVEPGRSASARTRG